MTHTRAQAKAIERIKPLHWMKGTPSERFWHLVKKTDGCWVWCGLTNQYGYGKFVTRGKIWRAHRFAWNLTQGAIQEGKMLCHVCNNKLCVNPKHLYLGTHKSNALDSLNAGTFNRNQHLKGIPQPAKLTWAQVCAIRKLSNLYSSRQLGKRFNVSYKTIGEIISRQTWKQEPVNV